MNMDECPVCGYGLDDCYDDDPGWMLCRDCEWCGYHDDLKRANEAKSTPPDMSDNPNTYALRLAPRYSRRCGVGGSGVGPHATLGVALARRGLAACGYRRVPGAARSERHQRHAGCVDGCATCRVRTNV